MESLKAGVAIKVVKGCRALFIDKGARGAVESVTALGPEYSHFARVVLRFGARKVALYVRHPNRLADPEVRLNTGDPTKVIVIRQMTA